MIEKLECTCIEAYKTRKMRDPNCCACSCDHNDLVEQLAKANESVKELENSFKQLIPIVDTLYALARNQLWIAYVWNDHNFPLNPEKYAKEAAESMGITNVDDANKLVETFKQIRNEQE